MALIDNDWILKTGVYRLIGLFLIATSIFKFINFPYIQIYAIFGNGALLITKPLVYSELIIGIFLILSRSEPMLWLVSWCCFVILAFFSIYLVTVGVSN